MQRGQIFSADFLFSVAVIVLALGVAVQAIDLSNHARQQDFLNEGLRAEAAQASSLLMANEAWLCQLETAEGENVPLDNCLDAAKTPTKEGLGLSAGFGCQVRGLAVQGCEGEPPTDRDVAAVKRVAVSGLGEALSWETFKQCKAGGECPLSAPKEIEVKVWRA